MNRLWRAARRALRKEAAGWRVGEAIIAEAETAGWRKLPARENSAPPATGDETVPGQRGVQRVANGQRPAPAPPWDQPLPTRHGGLRTTIDVWEDGRTIITDHRTRRRQVIPGYCTHCVDAVSAAVDDLLRDIR